VSRADHAQTRDGPGEEKCVWATTTRRCFRRDNSTTLDGQPNMVHRGGQVSRRDLASGARALRSVVLTEAISRSNIGDKHCGTATAAT
jgi:hypothetical protein